MTAASEMANRIAYAVLAVDADQPSPEVAIDAELQEVRTVIEALLDVVVTEGAESYSQTTCQRARALMEKLKV